MDIFFGTDTSPSSGDSSPVIIRKIVVLPEPFGPTRPTFSPGLSWKEVSTNRTCRPYCLLMRERDSTTNILSSRRGDRRQVGRSPWLPPLGEGRPIDKIANEVLARRRSEEPMKNRRVFKMSFA